MVKQLFGVIPSSDKSFILASVFEPDGLLSFVLVGNLTIFLPLFLALFLLSLFIFLVTFYFCVKIFFSSPRISGVYGDT